MREEEHLALARESKAPKEFLISEDPSGLERTSLGRVVFNSAFGSSLFNAAARAAAAREQERLSLEERLQELKKQALVQEAFIYGALAGEIAMSFSERLNIIAELSRHTDPEAAERLITGAKIKQPIFCYSGEQFMAPELGSAPLSQWSSTPGFARLRYALRELGKKASKVDLSDPDRSEPYKRFMDIAASKAEMHEIVGKVDLSGSRTLEKTKTSVEEAEVHVSQLKAWALAKRASDKALFDQCFNATRIDPNGLLKQIGDNASEKILVCLKTTHEVERQVQKLEPLCTYRASYRSDVLRNLMMDQGNDVTKVNLDNLERVFYACCKNPKSHITQMRDCLQEVSQSLDLTLRQSALLIDAGVYTTYDAHKLASERAAIKDEVDPIRLCMALGSIDQEPLYCADSSPKVALLSLGDGDVQEGQRGPRIKSLLYHEGEADRSTASGSRGASSALAIGEG